MLHHRTKYDINAMIADHKRKLTVLTGAEAGSSVKAREQKRAKSLMQSREDETK